MTDGWDRLANEASVKTTMSALKRKGYEAFLVPTGKEALSKIKNLVPKGASVMNGSSTTLKEIGYIDYLKSEKHGWRNLHGEILGEKDQVKQKELKKLAFTSDYYLGSVHALIENGEFVVASNTASQLPHVTHTSPNLIFVVSTKKIVPDFESAMKRLNEHVVPLEDKRMMDLYGTGTMLNKILIFKGESPFVGRKIIFILVNERLGF